MREIVVCGEALVDVVSTTAPGPDPSHLPPLQPALGGGPFNVAITLGRLGSAVSFCSAVSTDTYGDAIVAALSAGGVGTTLVQRRSEPTSLALATIGSDGAAHYSFYVEGTADRLVSEPGDFAATVSAVCFGTLSMVLEPGASVYELVMRRAHDAGRLVALDPNIRPSVIDEPDVYRRRFLDWVPMIDVLKLSDEDVDWLGDGADGSSVDDWLREGAGAVVITHGADGISVRTREFTVLAQAPETTVVDTIGAGDSALGGLLHFFDESGDLSASAVRSRDADYWLRAADYAARVAAVTVSRPGADPPWASELDAP
ncbi:MULTISPECIES: carbohydrate kinase family protein [Gordonia]|uniref:carbohydrate kinase family protein n=1 Tax=Gordonia TaxID=2053 RepID=UPI0007E9D160|nr:carbohydrate kinase [Gordonia sp. 852002-51296_SCH5728562-b]OBA36954.1 sugar kinase [Gordonia sp. 852002-51296_SCH5728562-b]